MSTQMSPHMQRHRAQMQKLAYPAVEAFITQHPEYTIAPNQSGSDSATNYVIFGTLGDEPVIFKYFYDDERKAREVYALHHFAPTGLVPRLLVDHNNRLIAQSRIPGGWLPKPDAPNADSIDSDRAGYTLGEAVAKLLAVPLSPQAGRDYEDRFYDGLTLENYLGNILSASRQIHQNIEAYSGPLFAQSLASIEANLATILAQPRLLYHQDAMNMHFANSQFTGFFDLEMCRVGTEAMQIGSLWYIFAIHNNWQAFAQGYAKITGRTLTAHEFAAAQAFAHFLVWRYISRSGRYRAQPDDAATLAQAEADAPQYAASIELNNRVTYIS